MNVVCTHYYVDIWCALTHLIFVFLSQATRHHDLALATQLNALFFPRLEPTKTAVQLFIGVLTNTAGIENYEICVVFTLSSFHTVLLEQPRDALGVMSIHLAPKGAHNIFTSHRSLSLPPHIL